MRCFVSTDHAEVCLKLAPPCRGERDCVTHRRPWVRAPAEPRTRPWCPRPGGHAVRVWEGTPREEAVCACGGGIKKKKRKYKKKNQIERKGARTDGTFEEKKTVGGVSVPGLETGVGLWSSRLRGVGPGQRDRAEDPETGARERAQPNRRLQR